MALSELSDLIDTGFEKAVATTLSLNYTTGGSLVSEALTISTSAAQSMPIQGQPLKTSIFFAGGALMAIPNAAIDMVEREFMMPNLNGIPISTEQISVSRKVTVNEDAVILQEGYQQAYAVNNAVPRLRQWSVKGWITPSIGGLDVGLTIKPTLQAQVRMLDAISVSRMPAVFKTSENEMVKVIVENYTIERTVKGNNAYAVSLSLKEFKPLKANNSSGTVKSLIEVITGR